MAHASPTRTVEEHLGEILDLVDPLPAVTLPLAQCLGLTLHEDLAARLPAPPFTNSSMDGFAVRAADVAGASAERPVELPVSRRPARRAGRRVGAGSRAPRSGS